MTTEIECPGCAGDGFTVPYGPNGYEPQEICTSCDGKGKVSVEEKPSIDWTKLPDGIVIKERMTKKEATQTFVTYWNRKTPYEKEMERLSIMCHNYYLNMKER